MANLLVIPVLHFTILTLASLVALCFRDARRIASYLLVVSFVAAMTSFVSFGLFHESDIKKTAEAQGRPAAHESDAKEPNPQSQAGSGFNRSADRQDASALVQTSANRSNVPAYCASKAAQRLVECGWTAEKQRQFDAADKADEEARTKHDSATLYLLMQKAKSMCARPIGELTLDELQDCNRPGMRMLRGAN